MGLGLEYHEIAGRSKKSFLKNGMKKQKFFLPLSPELFH